MLTVDTCQLPDLIDNLNHAAGLALHNQSSDAFLTVERQLSELDVAVRELQQTMWAEEAKTALKHLQKNLPLTPQDEDVIRAFIVSDAERYLAHENNYEDWLEELQRLLDDMAKRATQPDREAIADLRGVVKDAVRLVPDIRNYLDERNRVDRFEKSLKNLDQSSRDMLVRIMKEQLASPDR